MRKNIIFVVCAVVIVAIAILGTIIYIANKPPKNINIDPGATSQATQAKINQMIVINLTSNPSTGFSWQLADSYNKAVVTKESNTFTKNNSDAIGAPGTEVWTFKAVGKGSTTLDFSYLKSWEPNTAPAQTKQINITVK